jgi:hypothetical protein
MKIYTVCKKLAYLSFSCILGSFSASSADHLEPTVNQEIRSTRNIIDNHLQNPQLNLLEMQDVVKTTIQTVPYFKPLQPFFTKCDEFTSVHNLSTLEGLADLSLDQRAVVSIYAHIKESLNKDCSVHTHIIKLGNLCSLFLSYKSLNTDTVTAWASHRYDLIKTAGRKAQKYLLSPPELEAYHEKKRRINEIKTMYNSLQTVVLSSDPDVPPENHLLPLVLLEGSTFDKEDFFYALSKGIVLFGVQTKAFPGHGRVFESPYLAWRHDFGHFQTLCKGAPGQSSTILNQHIHKLSFIASKILDRASQHESNGANETKGLIIDAGFNVVHESNLPSWHPKQNEHNYLGYIITSAINSDMGFGEFSRNVDEEFAYRFLSDLPKDLVRRQPHLQEKIQIIAEKKRYLTKDDYNWITTLTILKDQFSWLRSQLFPTL